MKVLTVSGKEALKKDCRAIKNKETSVTEFFLKGDINVKNSGDVFYFTFKEPSPTGKKGNYIKLSNGNIFYDHKQGRYVRKSEVNNITFGVVDFTEDLNPVFGKFSEEDGNINFNRYYDPNQGSFPLMNKGLIEKGNLEFTTSRGEPYYISPNMYSKAKFRNLMEPYQGKIMFRDKLLRSSTSSYGAEGNSLFSAFVSAYKNRVLPNIEINNSLNLFSRFLDDYTFGIEIETCAGGLPEDFLLENALLPVKDGSIQGHEYITVPLQGSSGLSYVNTIFDNMEKYTRANQSCSLHIHFGNTGPKTREFLASIYTLNYRIQNELKDFLPPYKKASQYLNSKKDAKDHCKFLPNLFPYNAGEFNTKDTKTISDNVYAFFNEGVLNSSSNFDKPVYNGNNKNKWDQLSRYYILNLVPYLFKPQETIEFRFHSGTVNKTKSLIWLFICSATLSYARAYPNKILSMDSKLTLKDVINGFRNNFGQEKETPEGIFLADYINSYIFSRKKEFINQTIKNFNINDISDIYDKEFKNDHKFKFNLNKKNLVNFVS